MTDIEREEYLTKIRNGLDSLDIAELSIDLEDEIKQDRVDENTFVVLEELRKHPEAYEGFKVDMDPKAVRVLMVWETRADPS